ncbi:MAG: YqaE/Pmp3 family membrane protein [Sphingomonas sp.]|nr:YqaE/Pmp3 family membrane protein [Sphingomonas sp.]
MDAEAALQDVQITLIGWLPAAIWAVYALSQYDTDQKIEQAFRRR